MDSGPINVLFACTGNAARSILAESLLNALGGGRFRAYSAGPHPSRQVHPLALDVLAEGGYGFAGLRPKSWNEFTGADAARLDFVILLCDRAAAQLRPALRGRPMSVEWIVEDPLEEEGTDAEKRRAFRRVLSDLRRRIQHFTSLPFESVDPRALRVPLMQIGNP